MFNRRMFVSTAIFVMLFSLLCVVSAEAHFFSIVPNTEIHEVAVGSTYEAKLSFTEAFLNAEVGWTPADIFSARFVYKDGTETNFPTFERHFVSVDVKSGDQTITKRRNDYLHAQATLGKMGTVILNASGDLAPRMAYKGYSKQILNARRDGASTKRVGGDGVLEIVPLSEVADFVPGKTVAFKVFVKGQPLKGVKIEWADEKSPVVRPKGPNGRLGSPENTKTIAITDEDGIFDFTLRNAGYNCFGLMPPGIPSGRYKDGKEIKEWFASTLIIDVPASAAGGSSSAVIPVEPDLPEAVSKDKRLQSVAAQPFSNLSRAEKAFSASVGLTSSDLAASPTGAVTVSQAVAEAARAAAEKAYGKALPVKVNPMPILKMKLDEKGSADIAVMGIELIGSVLGGASPADVKLVKVTGPETGVLLGYLSDPAKFGDVKDGAFTILDDKGTVVSYIDPGKKYVLTLLIKDNGDYDLSKEEKTIVDPVVILTRKTPTPTPMPTPTPTPTPDLPHSNKGSSGCDAGFGGLMLAFVGAFLLRKKA